MIAINVRHFIPSTSIISGVFDPKLFKVFDSVSISKPSLSGNTCDNVSLVEIYFNPFIARVFWTQLFLWTPGTTWYLLVQSEYHTTNISINILIN